MRASFRRRLIALVAAYAVALNALLPALAVAMPAGPEATAFSIICAAASLDSTSNGDSAPVGHGHGPGYLHGMACLMAGCGGIAALGSETRRANAFVLGTIPIVFVARPSHDGSVRRIFDGHFARAPPAV